MKRFIRLTATFLLALFFLLVVLPIGCRLSAIRLPEPHVATLRAVDPLEVQQPEVQATPTVCQARRCEPALAPAPLPSETPEVEPYPAPEMQVTNAPYPAP